ncbi:MAG: hypothetical protein RLZ86_679 [Actinomycetota bacterium]|jgi:membrane protein YdbS with pleckstrin-like domain
MPYPRRLLNDGEEIALDIHPHWWFMSRPAAAFLVSGVLFLWLLAVLDGAAWETGLKWIVGLVALASLVWLAIRWLVWRTTHFVITSDRVIARKGVVAKSGIEIPLERVNNVSFKQSLFERLIDAGDLLIESGGEDGQQRFTDILKPDQVQNLIHVQMEENHRRSFSFPPPSSGSDDLAEQLMKLEGLRDRGSISDEEFERAKRRLFE